MGIHRLSKDFFFFFFFFLNRLSKDDTCSYNFCFLRTASHVNCQLCEHIIENDVTRYMY